uniref:Uncharacterized protein n=1 Tax=Anguilla anguilla TaxID=7936 RepID=A0A0E9X2C3_ANGAN
MTTPLTEIIMHRPQGGAWLVIHGQAHPFIEQALYCMLIGHGKQLLILPAWPLRIYDRSLRPWFTAGEAKKLAWFCCSRVIYGA